MVSGPGETEAQESPSVSGPLPAAPASVTTVFPYSHAILKFLMWLYEVFTGTLPPGPDMGLTLQGHPGRNPSFRAPLI